MEGQRRSAPSSDYRRSRGGKHQRRRRQPVTRRELALGLIVLACLVGVIGNTCHQRKKPSVSAAVPTREEAVPDTAAPVEPNVTPEEEKSETASMEEYIASHEEDYPESLRDLLERNPEALQFVYDYPEAGEETPEIDLSGEVTQGEIPLFLQWDERWGYQKYGSDMIAITGCGPTCLSMVYSGLTGKTDKSPLDVAHFSEEKGYYINGEGTSWTLMSEGAAQLGLDAEELPLSGQLILNRLNAGRPVISSMGAGDFTDRGHYIVLLSVNQDGTIAINDPFSPQNSKKGWKLERLMEQMENLWAYTAG